MKKPNRRTIVLGALGVFVLVILLISFRSPAILVDSATVKQDRFQIVVEEEGRTRLPDRYQVSAPVSGHLNRVLLEPGDAIEQGDTLFTLSPSPAEALDARTLAQAQASLSRAQASLSAAKTQVEAAEARDQLAEKELDRMRQLEASAHVPRSELERAQAEARGTNAQLRSAQFAVEIARHELSNARAALSIAGGEQGEEALIIAAPIDGVVLQRERQSAGRIQPGETVLTLGDLAALQVEVDLLSPDAVRLRPGMRVELERWGGEEQLTGRVRRIEPAGFTHISALGVEEQRVWVIVDFEAEREQWSYLGDGYRVEARFILWEGDEVLQVPASALFREGDAWSVYVMDGNRANRRSVEPGRRSGLMAEITQGLEAGEVVILHPGQDIETGARVRAR